MLSKVFRAIFITLAVISIFTSAYAQSYPQKSVTIIAPFAPGGSADGIARLIARELSKSFGQPVVVENKPGAGGATGLISVARSNPDGYTIGMGATGALTIAPHLPDAPPLHPQKQLQPLAKVADIPLVLVAGSKSGYTDLQILLSKAKNGEVSVGNSGQYTAQHLSSELLATTAKVHLVSIPYRGSGPAVSDLLGGQVPVGIVDLTSVAAHIKSGNLRALAVTSATRTKLAPEIPTMAEAGVPGYAAPAWMGIFGPKGLPAGITDRIAKEIAVVMANTEVQNQILALAAEPTYLGPTQFAAYIDQESNRWLRVIASIPKPKQ